MSTVKSMRRYTLGVVLAFVVLVTSMVIAHPETAMAYTTMRITSGNFTTLNGFPTAAYGTGSKLKYTYGVKLNTYGGAEYNRSGYYRIGDGQCVYAVKALSNVWKSTSYWVKGGRVTAGGVTPGVVIATFGSTGKYYGHVAIFRRYIKNSAGTITGIEVWDQNWSSPLDGMFRKHILYKTGSGLADADNYYWVKY